jgi:arylsulfatase A-like enzyme
VKKKRKLEGAACPQGMTFTDCYTTATCTANRANFINGEIPRRAGLITAGQT